MKSRNVLTLILFLTFTILLSSCGGPVAAANWAGYSANGDKLYLSDRNGVYAINSDNGTLVWQYPEKVDGKRSYFAAPVVVGEQLIVGDYLNAIHSLNLANGTEKWKYETTHGKFISSVAVDQDTILGAASDKYLYALDFDGNLRWKFETSAANWSQPVIDGTVAYLASMDHHLYSMDIKSGSKIWKADLGGAIVAGMSMDNDHIFIGTLSNEVLSINKKDGTVAWRFATDGAIWAIPAYKDGTIYFGDKASTFYAVDAKTGLIQWRLSEIGKPIVGTAGIFEKGVVFSTEDGKLVAIDFSGQRLWEKQINGKLYSSPVITGDKIIIGMIDGDAALKAYDFNGSEIWLFDLPK